MNPITLGEDQRHTLITALYVARERYQKNVAELTDFDPSMGLSGLRDKFSKQAVDALAMAELIHSAKSIEVRSSEELQSLESHTISGWLNVYQKRVAFYPAKAQADMHAVNSRIACVPFNTTVSNGEGL